MTTSYIIGFATKFYTLWSVSNEPYTNQYGEQIGVTHRYAFIKKISTSLERARALFPDTPVDESLRGHRSFNRFESFRPQYADDEFAFGKLAGTKVADCRDSGYLAYVWNGLTDQQKTIATPVLVSSGYHMVGGDLMTSAQYNRFAEHVNFENTAKSGNAFDVLFEKSLDEYGNYWFKGLTIHFPEFNVNCYNGFYYALPVVNGHAKRIKSKMVHIAAYDYDGESKTITVKSFEILK